MVYSYCWCKCRGLLIIFKLCCAATPSFELSRHAVEQDSERPTVLRRHAFITS